MVSASAAAATPLPAGEVARIASIIEGAAGDGATLVRLDDVGRFDGPDGDRRRGTYEAVVLAGVPVSTGGIWSGAMVAGAWDVTGHPAYTVGWTLADEAALSDAIQATADTGRRVLTVLSSVAVSVDHPTWQIPRADPRGWRGNAGEVALRGAAASARAAGFSVTEGPRSIRIEW